jgi:hypothetical protein
MPHTFQYRALVYLDCFVVPPRNDDDGLAVTDYVTKLHQNQ